MAQVTMEMYDGVFMMLANDLAKKTPEERKKRYQLFKELFCKDDPDFTKTLQMVFCIADHIAEKNSVTI